jgi:hypothetical protein
VGVRELHRRAQVEARAVQAQILALGPDAPLAVGQTLHLLDEGWPGSVLQSPVVLVDQLLLVVRVINLQRRFVDVEYPDACAGSLQ